MCPPLTILINWRDWKRWVSINIVGLVDYCSLSLYKTLIIGFRLIGQVTQESILSLPSGQSVAPSDASVGLPLAARKKLASSTLSPNFTGKYPVTAEISGHKVSAVWQAMSAHSKWGRCTTLTVQKLGHCRPLHQEISQFVVNKS